MIGKDDGGAGGSGQASGGADNGGDTEYTAPKKKGKNNKGKRKAHDRRNVERKQRAVDDGAGG